MLDFGYGASLNLNPDNLSGIRIKIDIILREKTNRELICSR
jgi:hypothetical protein